MKPRKTDERRWVILAEDGTWVTLGRYSDPSSEEISDAERSLQAIANAGWLAIMQGSPYSRPAARLMLVRPLAGPTRTFDEAVLAFQRRVAATA